MLWNDYGNKSSECNKCIVEGQNERTKKRTKETETETENKENKENEENEEKKVIWKAGGVKRKNSK